MCFFLKVCPFPTLLRCRDEEWRSRRASHVVVSNDLSGKNAVFRIIIKTD